MVPVSNDTLLRVVRRRAHSRTAPLTVVGVDDWAFRRNHRCGTIVCDLERRRIVKLLPDHEIATVAAWLTAHPGIRVVSRGLQDDEMSELVFERLLWSGQPAHALARRA